MPRPSDPAHRATSGSSESVPGTDRGRWIDSGILFLLALGIRLRDLSFAPDVDEFHHILAAQSLLTEGNLTLAGGELPYTSGLLFTLLVAGFFALVGDSVEVARLPAILGGAALVAVAYLWVRSASNRLAGWVAALLLCTYPFGIYLTQVSRFYSLHALFFLLGVMAAYKLASGEWEAWPRGMALLAGAAGALTIAFHLQVATVVGVGALGIWVLVDRGAWFVAWVRDFPRPWVPLGVGAVLLLSAVGAVWLSGFADRALSLFQYADPWAFDQRENLRYYHWRLQSDFGPIWAFFPVLLLVTLYRNWRFGLLCGAVFGVVFVVHSFAAWKHPRYIFYVMPFFFAIVGVAAAEIVPALGRILGRLLEERAGWMRSAATRAVVLGCAAVGATAFALAGFGAFSDFTRMMQPGPDPLESPRPFRGKAEWAEAQPTLEELSRDAEVLVSYSHLKPQYYLGRLDVILQRNHLFRGDGWAPEFAIQDQLALPVISRPESLAGIVACHDSGIVIGEHFGWSDPAGVPAETVAWIEAELDPVPLPPEWRLLVYTWDHGAEPEGVPPEGVPPTLDCSLFPVGVQRAGGGG